VRSSAALLLWAALLCSPAALSPRASEPEEFQVVKKLVQEGVDATAAEQARAYLEHYPQGANRDQVAAWLGQLLAARGEAAEALKLLEAPLPKLPPKARGPVNFARARAYMDLRQPAKAKPLLDNPGPYDRADAPLFRRLQARLAMELDQPAEAVRALRALATGERGPEDEFLLARALVLAQDDAGARAVAEALLAAGGLPPGREADLRLLLAGSLYRLGEFAAVPPPLRPLESDPSRAAEALLLQAWALHRTGEDARAYDLARKAVPLVGWEDGALLAPLRAARFAEDTGAMVSAARAFLAARPDSDHAYEAHLALAHALEARGDAPSALKELETALPSIPSGPARGEAALTAARLAAGELHDWPRARRHFALAREVASSDPARADALLASARAAWSLGAAGDALAAVAQLVRDYAGTPAVPGAYLLLGDLRCAEGERAQGREAYSVLLESFPDSPEFSAAALAMARTLRAEGDVAGARETLGLLAGLPLPPAVAAGRDRLAAELALEEGDSASVQAALLDATGGPPDTGSTDRGRFLLGLARLAAGDPEGASEEFASIADPALAEAGRFRLARALMETDRFDEGAALLQSLALSDGPGACTALWTLSEAYAKAGDAEKSSETLRRLAAKGDSDPLAALAQRKIELSLLSEDGPAAALEVLPAFREAEPVSPGRAADLLRAARLRVEAGDGASAERLWGDYLGRFPAAPGAAEAALGLARAAARRSDWKEARRVLLAAPAGPARDLLLGRACFALRDLPAAQEAYERALGVTGPAALAPAELLESRYRAGLAAAIQGKKEQARTHWSVFAAKAPADPAGRETLFQVALWLQRQGDPTAALAALDRLRATWRDASVGFQHGYTLEILGRKEDALASYLKVAYASSNAQWALTARYRAAELLVDLGRREDAIALYRELATRTEGTVQGDYAKKRLKALESPEPPAAQEPAPPEEAPDAPAAPTH